MKNYKSIIMGIISFFAGATALYLVMTLLPGYKPQTIINKQEKEITVTDKGIADAVEKIFDAVVVVENHVGGRAIGMGTGFIYKVNGNKAYLLTNNHVINRAEKVFVTLTSDEQIEAEILGSDKYNDVAVLTIDAKYAKQIAEIGDSESMRLGDTVFTVGAPLNNKYSGTITRGIISGKDRLIEVSTSGSIFGADYIMRVIQTDASINSGNSGGPLADSNGQVIGITSSKLVSSGVEGMGFAIPIEDAIEFANIIEKDGKVVRPSLGVSAFDVSQAQNFSNIKIDPSVKFGAVVSAVVEGSPAQKSGIQVGDVIIAIGNNKVDSTSSLKYHLYKHKVGDSPMFKVNRAGKETNIKVNLDKGLDS